MWVPRFFPADKLLLAIANFLCALGVLILYTTDRGAGTSRGIQQAIYYGAGIIAMLACIFVVRYVRRWGFLIKVVMLGAAALLALPLAIGTEQNGATNWINIGRYQRAAQRAGEAGAASDLELVHVAQAIFAVVRVRGVFAAGADAAAGPGHGADLLCHHAVFVLRLHRQPAADGAGGWWARAVPRCWDMRCLPM